MPALITLGTRLILRAGEQTREIALEDFYIDYQKTALQLGEFILLKTFGNFIAGKFKTRLPFTKRNNNRLNKLTKL
jgi:xanthine dehydrogenase iron-sulfur cluster and FAD-binding subunit A